MTTIRVTDRTQRTLRQLSNESGRPMQDVAAEAIEAYRRWRILERTNAAYATMQASPQVWREELEERAAWDNTLADGLGDP